MAAMATALTPAELALDGQPTNRAAARCFFTFFAIPGHRKAFVRNGAETVVARGVDGCGFLVLLTNGRDVAAEDEGVGLRVELRTVQEFYKYCVWSVTKVGT